MKKSTRVIAFLFALLMSLSTAMTAALASYATIPYGERSDRVRKMQMALKKKGYYKGTVDGKFGPSTKQAVKKYQTSLGITADGHPGNTTLTALYEGRSAINKTNNTAAKQVTVSNPNTLYYGCTGSRVRSLQVALRRAGCYGGAIDGVYGDLTMAAVKKYQARQGLHVDGMAGAKTLRSLRKKTNTPISGSFILDIGSRGQEVKSVAQALGYDPVTTYDAGLAAKVKAWQKGQGLKETGTVNINQYNAIVLK